MTADINRLLDEYRDACVAYKENCDRDPRVDTAIDTAISQSEGVQR